ncbi:MAG: hypothetical protein ACK46E_04725, partial [Pseudanabaena sp.]|jgi:hypothetical protein
LGLEVTLSKGKKSRLPFFNRIVRSKYVQINQPHPNFAFSKRFVGRLILSVIWKRQGSNIQMSLQLMFLVEILYL